jgi:hypothetical protein
MKLTPTGIYIGLTSLCLSIFLTSAQALEQAQSMPASAPAAELAQENHFDARAIIASAGLRAHAIAEKYPAGYIDWTAGRAIAVGEGKATGTTGQQIDLANRAARLAAARNAILLMGNIRATASGKFVDIANANIQVDAVLNDFEEISSAYDPKTHTATVSLAVPLYGARGVIHILGTGLASPARASAQGQSQASTQIADSVIVIDARGTAIKPCLLPRIVSDQANEVIFAASQSDLGNHPAGVYVTLPAGQAGKTEASLQAQLPTVLVLQACQVDDKTPGAIVLNAQESARLRDYPNWREHLSAGRLIVITGQAR